MGAQLILYLIQKLLCNREFLTDKNKTQSFDVFWGLFFYSADRVS